MNNNRNKLEKELKKGENLNKNVPLFLQEMASDFVDFASMQLLMEGFLYYEDGAGLLKLEYEPVVQKIIEQWNQLLTSFCQMDSTEKSETLFQEVEQLHRDVAYILRDVLIYQDYFNLFYYGVARQKLKFQENLKDIDHDETVRRILQLIFCTEDNYIVNDNIKQMLSSLPIRITKAKFFEYLKGGFECIRSADQKSVDRYVFFIKTAAGLLNPDRESFPETDKIRKKILTFNLNSLEKVEFDYVQQELDDKINEFSAIKDVLCNIALLLNNLNVILLNKTYADRKILDNLQSRVEYYKQFSLVGKEEFTDAMGVKFEAAFVEIEGKLENYSELFLRQGLVLENLRKNPWGYEFTKEQEELYNILARSEVLITSNLFGNMDSELYENEHDKETSEAGVVDLAAYALMAGEEVASQLSKVFSEGNQLLNRARMAAVLAQLPVFFNNRTEVFEYVKNSIDTCRSLPEKLASVYAVISKIS